jgi:5-formyltetrahydrofolate cyclo-ligase
VSGADAVIAARKQALRTALRRARRAIDPDERRRATAQVVERVWAHVQDGSNPLASYLASGGELDLDDLHRRWWSLGRVVWLPRVTGPDTLAWHPLPDPSATITGAFGLREPDPARISAAPLPADATVLVPGVGFTSDGHRLGQGRGFYDRVLASHHGHTIGIAFRCQMLDDLPHAAHDRRVAAVICA